MIYKKMPKLSERLKYIRHLHDLSQAELAEKAGTTQQAIQQAEAGKARQPRYLHKLAQELDISVEWMVFGQPPETNEKKPYDHKTGFDDRASDVLQNFFSMPEDDQQLIFQLMKSRQKNKTEK